MSHDPTTTKRPKPRLIRPTNLMRARLPTKAGPSLEQIVADAQAALEVLKDDFEVWIRDDLKALSAAVAEAERAPDPTTTRRIHTLSHEIKGQGSTYGYPLLTRIGDLLCRLLEDVTVLTPRQLELTRAHVEFMQLVVTESIRDEADERARKLLGALESAAAAVSAPQRPN